jgi:hypothetical protein
MRRIGRDGALLVILCAGAIAVAVALATAAFGSADAHRRRAHPARCKQPPRSHQRRAGHRSRCPASRRSGAHHPSSAPLAGAPSAGAGAPGTSTPAASQTGAGAPPAGGESGSPAQAPPQVPHVQVTAVEFGFSLSRTSVPAGKVIIEFDNHGQDEHNLNLVKGEGALAGSFANLPSHGVAREQLDMPRGTYTLFCSLPEHEQKA